MVKKAMIKWNDFICILYAHAIILWFGISEFV